MNVVSLPTAITPKTIFKFYTMEKTTKVKMLEQVKKIGNEQLFNAISKINENDEFLLGIMNEHLSKALGDWERNREYEITKQADAIFNEKIANNPDFIELMKLGKSLSFIYDEEIGTIKMLRNYNKKICGGKIIGNNAPRTNSSSRLVFKINNGQPVFGLSELLKTLGIDSKDKNGYSMNGVTMLRKLKNMPTDGIIFVDGEVEVPLRDFALKHYNVEL